MSPDIEWHITDESNPQTIVKTTEPKPPRRRALAVLVVIVLGIGLGLVYRSIPTPAAQPLPPPTPTSEPEPESTGLPPALYRVVDREAQALAAGDSSVFTNESAATGTQLNRFQHGGFRPWGRPPDGSVLYKILDFSLQTPESAWVEARQYRNGRYFRETRFYRQHAGDWSRSEPDLQLWSSATESSDTLHFHVIYPIEDRGSIGPIVQQFEKDYSQLCEDLACATVVPCLTSQTLTRCSPILHEMTFTLAFSPQVSQSFFQFASNVNELRLPSPRIMGVFEQGDPIGPENSFYLGGLAQLITQRRAYGTSSSRDGMAILRAPEPPRPIATPLPPAPSLAETIDQEARALASGDMQTFIGLLDPDEYAWRQDQISSFIPWGAPPSNDKFYRILATERTDAQHAWADVLQYRDGKFFRETRVYRLLNSEWLRTPLSDARWWGDKKTMSTRYFQITYASADEELIRLLAGYLTRQSRETCRTFGCNFDEQPPAVHLIIRSDSPEVRPAVQRSGSTFTVTLPSPRLAGYYAADMGGVEVQDEHWDQYFDRYLYFPLLYTATGGVQRWAQNRDGLMYLYAIGFWDLAQRSRVTLRRWEFPYKPELVTDMLALSAEARWDWPADASEGDIRIRLANASALVQFIDETYGRETVMRFFRTLRFAQSLTRALSRLGVPYDEFEAKWLAWSSRNETKKPELSN
jgi:hypothetical protein